LHQARGKTATPTQRTPTAQIAEVVGTQVSNLIVSLFALTIGMVIRYYFCE
jgi:hypothetical protein